MPQETTDITKSWFSSLLKDEKPIYVFGPSSAESEEQVVSVASEISKKYPDAIFRAGIWKPRTRPNNFEGIGSIGLPWLQRTKEEFDLKVASEVANAEHVEACLKAGIDVLWIGARTTVNPFYVQEIAEALKGVDIPVMIKNPVAPDLNLWIGAIERIQQSGITDLAAIHRGFQVYASKPYRNHPQWEIPIQLMADLPDIPVICDISHIGGDPVLFKTLAQKALDLDMAGLHIEVHPKPAEALSDAKQQITPTELEGLLSSLEFRRSQTDNPDYLKILDQLREEIDDVDKNLIMQFGERMEVIKKMGVLKKKNHVTILQVKRWQSIVDRYMEEGKRLGLSESFLKALLNVIHDESMRIQHDIMND